jgi:hypothetical protein
VAWRLKDWATIAERKPTPPRSERRKPPQKGKEKYEKIMKEKGVRNEYGTE